MVAQGLNIISILEIKGDVEKSKCIKINAMNDNRYPLLIM